MPSWSAVDLNDLNPVQIVDWRPAKWWTRGRATSLIKLEPMDVPRFGQRGGGKGRREKSHGKRGEGDLGKGHEKARVWLG